MHEELTLSCADNGLAPEHSGTVESFQCPVNGIRGINWPALDSGTLLHPTFQVFKKSRQDNRCRDWCYLCLATE